MPQRAREGDLASLRRERSRGGRTKNALSLIDVSLPVDETHEWLEADGLGGFASGTTSGLRTRRYHALLLAAASPPGDRRALVQSFVARLEAPAGSAELFPQAYAGGVVTGREAASVEFSLEPWPAWRIETRFGAVVRVEIFAVHAAPSTVVTFRRERGTGPARLSLRPLFSGRDFHASHHENGAFSFAASAAGRALRFAPYPGVPAVLSLANAEYRHEPDWYRRFYYEEEAARGLDAVEDLASPGVLSFDLAAGEGVWVLCAETPGALPLEREEPVALARELRERERARRRAFAGPLERAADAYLVRRGRGRTLIAGYPWFGDWGRDTFIAVRGLCLATGELETARAILLEWAALVSEGMLPNHFADGARGRPEYNSVDASLWFVLAADELASHPLAGSLLSSQERRRLDAAITDIASGYARGTRHGIRRDADGLLACGEASLQLTWMDAKVGGRVITPRIGKPVEIQALWVHALYAAAKRDPWFRAWADAARESLARRFWNPERGMLFDVVDDGHVPGAVDAACRPNQIFAAGGLPLTLLPPDQTRRVVDAVEHWLVTPIGVRTLEASHPAYVPHYRGGVTERDGAYHQGTVWPWLMGPFVEAWVKSRGHTAAAVRTARERFIAPLRAHLMHAGIGHVSEIADAEPPHTPRGCPFQAWSLGELLRLERAVFSPR